jgi:hypothetical protein
MCTKEVFGSFVECFEGHYIVCYDGRVVAVSARGDDGVSVVLVTSDVAVLTVEFVENNCKKERCNWASCLIALCI